MMQCFGSIVPFWLAALTVAPMLTLVGSAASATDVQYAPQLHWQRPPHHIELWERGPRFARIEQNDVTFSGAHTVPQEEIHAVISRVSSRRLLARQILADGNSNRLSKRDAERTKLDNVVEVYPTSGNRTPNWHLRRTDSTTPSPDGGGGDDVMLVGVFAGGIGAFVLAGCCVCCLTRSSRQQRQDDSLQVDAHRAMRREANELYGPQLFAASMRASKRAMFDRATSGVGSAASRTPSSQAPLHSPGLNGSQSTASSLRHQTSASKMKKQETTSTVTSGTGDTELQDPGGLGLGVAAAQGLNNTPNHNLKYEAEEGLADASMLGGDGEPAGRRRGTEQAGDHERDSEAQMSHGVQISIEPEHRRRLRVGEGLSSGELPQASRGEGGGDAVGIDSSHGGRERLDLSVESQHSRLDQTAEMDLNPGLSGQPWPQPAGVTTAVSTHEVEISVDRDSEPRPGPEELQVQVAGHASGDGSLV